MFKLFKEAFKTANDCIILAIPLVLFMWILSFYFGFSNSVVNSPAEIILAFITVLFMTGAFLSGWFHMVKKAIEISRKVFVLDADRAKATMDLFKNIPYGIGQYFLAFVLMLLAFLLIVAIAAMVVYLIGDIYIGNVFTPEQLSSALSSTQDMKTFIESLDNEQLIKLNLWNLLIMGTTTVLSFILMLWIPEIIYKTVNPLLALFRSIKKVFVKFKTSLGVFIYISVLNLVMSFIGTFTLINPLLYILIMTIYFYFIIYVVILLFLYYVREFSGAECGEETKA